MSGSKLITVLVGAACLVAIAYPQPQTIDASIDQQPIAEQFKMLKPIDQQPPVVAPVSVDRSAEIDSLRAELDELKKQLAERVTQIPPTVEPQPVAIQPAEPPPGLVIAPLTVAPLPYAAPQPQGRWVNVPVYGRFGRYLGEQPQWQAPRQTTYAQFYGSCSGGACAGRR